MNEPHAPAGALIPTTSSCRRNGWSLERTPPRVPVRREGPHFIFTQPCPYCGQKHRHGVGDNGFCYGHRTVHCADPHARLEETTLGYILVPAPGAERERLRGHLLEVLRRGVVPHRSSPSIAPPRQDSNREGLRRSTAARQEDVVRAAVHPSTVLATRWKFARWRGALVTVWRSCICAHELTKIRACLQMSGRVYHWSRFNNR
jgi:hypothetical protein